MFDPQNMPSSAGGFPWKADGDYTTVVYIKNETSVARKFVSHLVYEGGQYSPGIRDLKPGETIGIDFRALRDNQSPDSQENVIPLDVDTGQIAWSVLGAENKVLSGRSEQISLAGGVASTYACANCCPNVIDGVQVNPISLITEVSQVTQFTATQTERNCYDTQFGPYQADPNEWNSFDSGVATVDFAGNSDAVGVGDTNIEGCVERTIWYNWGGGYCEPFTDLMCDEAPVEVAPKVTINVPSELNDGSTSTFTATVTDATPTGYQWEVTFPNGAGNSPDLSFTSATSSDTGATAKWFANPNNACSAPNSSTYTVKLTVTFSNRGPITKQKSLAVKVPWNPGGVVSGSVNFTGGPQIEYSAGLWRVIGPGTWTWNNNNPTPSMNIPQSSHFYSKMYGHEMVHVGQWGATGLLGSQYSVTGLYAAVQNVTDANQQVFIGKLETAAEAYMASRFNAAKAQCNNAEIAAYTSSDSASPQYVYQLCQRTTFPNCN